MPNTKHANNNNNRHEVLAEEPHIGHNNIEQYLEEHDPSVVECCVPTLCTVGQMIHMTNLSEAVKVICNNDHCREGRYMHKRCFEEWEETVLTYLRSTGRARSWSEKQRLQNLWTKKGYDLAYKVCYHLIFVFLTLLTVNRLLYLLFNSNKSKIRFKLVFEKKFYLL